MRIRTSTKIFLTALIFFVGAFIFYLLARKVYLEELEKIKGSPFWGSTLYLSPDLNWWHYAALTAFCISVAITVAGFWLREREYRSFLNS